jgi:hypothetical protein
MVSTQPIVTNPFGSLFGTPGYNSQSIPSVSNPFSFGMPNMASQLSSSIPTTNANPSFGPGGMAPPRTPLSFGGSQIPQTNPTVGCQPHFSFGSNPILNAHRWSTQPGGQATSYITSFPPSSSTSILMNTFVMMNPPLSSEIPHRGGQFYAMGNPHLEDPLIGGNVYHPHYVTPVGMVPIQPLMNQFGGGYYPTRQGHGVYHNPGWFSIPQHQSFPGEWAQMKQPRLPFLATLNLPDFSRLINDPVCHDFS